MDIGLYRHYLNKYIQDALQESDGSKAGVAEYLSEIKIGGLLTRHKEEKRRAVEDARNAFEEHRHWPIDIILSHLGFEPDSLEYPDHSSGK
jgi:hypothetical protein